MRLAAGLALSLLSQPLFACKIGELKPIQLESGKNYEMVVNRGQEFYYPEESPTTLEFLIYDRRKDKVMVNFKEPVPFQKRKVKVWFGEHTQAFYFELNPQPKMAVSEEVFYRIKLRHKGKDSQLLVRVVDNSAAAQGRDGDAAKGGCLQPIIKEIQ